ncbi:MAG: carboxypeptidase-like regulatory domain-containing protein [Bacteroidota bacterium]|nr:carboxypeptidase-like regulatory domain-containing protein [Bacteroidota bacterium]
MRPSTTLHIPQPCYESWAGMSPTVTGRHCAACAQTVVDFTLKTDAEILAYLASAGSSRTCGRFAAGQLERPLQRAASTASGGRWRAWLAAAVAVWGLREGFSFEAKAQAATEWRARYWGGPVPVGPATVAPETTVATSALNSPNPAATALSPRTGQDFKVGKAVAGVSSAARCDDQFAVPLLVRGVVTDSISGEGLPGVTVMLPGTQIGVSTGALGEYELLVPAERVVANGVMVQVSSIGYATQRRTVAAASAEAQMFRLQNDVKGFMGLIVVPPRKMPPAPWRPRAFYHWGKYWLTRPFHRY